jgi:membrane protein YdbS with pleckstrin-like domain
MADDEGNDADDITISGTHSGNEAIGWRALPERVRRVWLVNETIGCAVTLAICAVATVICLANGWWGFWQPLIIGLFAAEALISLAFQPVQTKYAYTFNRFMIGERDMRLKKGWMFRSTTTIPFNRVQHVDTKQNPVLRHFGLTAVVVHTAVDEHEIEALDTPEAERVVALITTRVAAAKEDL